jgi:Carboxypeptidase regulatory-like domain
MNRLFVAAASAGAATALVLGAAAGPAFADAPPTATITGTVDQRVLGTDPVSVQPLGGATVTLLDANGVPVVGLAPVTTAADGSYTLASVPYGDYELAVTDSGGAPAGQSEVWYPDAYSAQAAGAITVDGTTATSGTVALNEIDLYAAGSISGAVTTTNGSTPSGASVTLTGGAGGTGTVDGGSFGIGGLAPAAYTVTLTAPGYFTADPQDVSLAEGQNSTVSFKLGPDVFTATPAPVISGTPAVGDKLTAAAPGWNPTPSSLGYQWYANGKAISGATASTYMLTAADDGSAITVTATGSLTAPQGSSGAPVTHTSSRSTATAAVKLGSLTAPTPTITGSVKVGSELTAKPGTWTSGTSLHDQWYANGKAITGATHTTLGLSAAYYGKVIAVRVTGSKSGYATVARTSRATGKVGRGTLSGSVPTITASSTAGGSPLVGASLRANPGHWTGGTALHYQWYANSSAISGATQSTYKIPANLLGRAISVRVTGTKTDYSSLASSSARTAAVIQTKAYYAAHSGNRSTYKVVVTGLETPVGAGGYGDPGDVDIATIAYPSIDLIDKDYTGASSYTKTYTLENPPSWWVGLLEVSADGGFDSNFIDQTATVKIYKKPAGAPDVYYSLEKSGSGNTVDLTINY